MAAATEPTIYDGTVGVVKNTTLLTHTAAKYRPKFVEAVFTATPFLKSLALNAFGRKAMIGDATFGNVTQTTGKGIQFDDGGYQFEFPLATDSPSGSIIGRMDTINPEYIDPMTGGAYACKRLMHSIYIPEEHIQDNMNEAKLISRLDTKMKLTQMQAITDINTGILGSSSAPTSSPTGLADLVAVTQTATIGGIASTNTYWQNQFRACTSVGGGGELDRPIQLLRSMQALKLDIRSKSGSTNEQTLVGTRGAFQYYLRAAYADTTAQARPNQGLKDYYDADIEHAVFDGRPFIYDGEVTVPTGATASTECIYFLDYNTFGVNFKRADYFNQHGGWEMPRVHERGAGSYAMLLITTRYVPFTTNRRTQGVLYNLPANADAS